MKILCAMKDRSELLQMQKWLSEQSHAVAIAQTVKEARDRLNEATPRCLLLDSELPFTESMALVKAIRCMASEHYLYVVWLHASENSVAPAYLNGCDADHPKKGAAALLKARLLTAERISALKSGEPWFAADANGTHAAIQAVSSSAAWQAFPHELASAAGTFLTRPLSLTRAPADASLEMVAGIVLANVEKQVEVRVLISTDKASAGVLTAQVFGEDSADLQVDMFGELANLSMGVLKTSFSKSGLQFTGGLPESISPEKYEEFARGCQVNEAFTLASENGARLRVQVGVASKRNEMVAISALQEGMILANDVRNERGMLLVKSGTRLSSTAVGQLRSLLNMKQTVEVAAGGR